MCCICLYCICFLFLLVCFFIEEQQWMVWTTSRFYFLTLAHSNIPLWFLVWVLKIQQLREFMYKYMYEHVFSFLWDKGPRVQLLGHVVKCVKICQTITRGAVPFYICTVNTWIAAFFQSLWYCYFHFSHSDRCIVTCHFLIKFFSY